MKKIRGLIDEYEAETKTETKIKTETKPKAQTRTITESKPKTETMTKSEIETDDNIYVRINYDCRECNEIFRSKVALTNQSDSHNRNCLEDTEGYDINSSLSMRQFYITDKAGNYIEEIIYLVEIKNCYQIRKVNSFVYKIISECE